VRDVVTLVALALVAGWPLGAGADPTSPVSVELPDDDLGNAFNVGVRLVEDLEQDYVEEEYFIAGNATVYTYDDPPVREEVIPLDPDVPYKTRITIRRPRVHGQFKGTVVIEWWNSTAGFDTAPVWDASAEYYARNGIIYVGVTNSNTSIDFLVGGCFLLGVIPFADCFDRYTTLSLPENGQAYEMVSQIANLLKSDVPENPLPEEFRSRVELIFHAGQSQQGGSMVTYATAFHFPVNDGYFVQAASSARPINFGPACGAEGSPPYPGCTPRLEGDQRRVRTDLPVPVYRAMTETDMEGVLAGDSRQEDTDTFRYYEMPGTAHVTVHEDVTPIPGLPSLEQFCLFPLNTLADGPVFGSYLYNAMWSNMEEQVRNGTPPPHGDLIETEDGELVRDEFENALGGIRLPQLDVPIATYGPRNTVDPSLPPFLQGLANLFCRLSGTVTDFDQATLDELYPTHGNYVNQVVRHAVDLVGQRFLLPKDAKQLKVDAAKSSIGCGLGFELVLVLPALLWLRRRRARGQRRDSRAKRSSGASTRRWRPTSANQSRPRAYQTAAPITTRR
jgi:hypothetical protein